MDYFLNAGVDGIGHLEVALINIARFALSLLKERPFTLVKEIYISINDIILKFIAIKKKENERLSKQNITIIGLGKTGLSCVDYLLSQQANIRVIDTRKNPTGIDKLPQNIPLHTGSLNQEWLLESDMIVISPGLAVKHQKFKPHLKREWK